MFAHFRNAAAAAALLVAIPSVAAARPLAYSMSPVSVLSCGIADGNAPLAIDEPLAFGGPATFRAPGRDGIALAYVDKSDVPATSVRFAISDGGRVQTVTAAGTFAPGIRIVRTFQADADLRATDRAVCEVAEVDFADGTTWHAAGGSVATR